MKQICAGIPPERSNYEVILDRRDAIARALSLVSGPDDCCAILGKGHESGQTENGVTRPFDDREVAREVLSQWVSERKQAA